MKRVKRLCLSISIIVGILASVFALSSCEKNKRNAQSLYDQGLEIIQLMSEMTRSEAYIAAYTSDSNIKSILQNISAGDFTTPKAVYAITIPDQSLAAMAELNNLGHVSEKIQSFLTQRYLSSLMTQINAMGGAENLAATSLCTAGKTFVNDKSDKNVIYLYTYDNAIPVAVTFTAGENHAVSASGVFINYEPFTCGSAEEIQTFFSDIIVEVTEVLPEN